MSKLVKGLLTQHMTSALAKLQRLIRWQEWYDTKVPFLFTIVFYIAWKTETSVYEFLLVFLSSTAFFCAYLAFGYMFNDFCDRDIDRKAGKNRLVGHIPTPVVWFLLVGMVALGVGVLWPFLRRPFVLPLIALNYLLAIAYSAPPLRIKEKGALGVIVASASQRSLPLLVIVAIFEFVDPAIVLLLILFFVVGLRWIFVHQIKDYLSDKESGVETYVTRLGPTKAFAYLLHYCLSLEILLVVSVSALISLSHWLFGVLSLVWAIQSYLFYRWGGGLSSLLKALQQESFLASYLFFFWPLFLAIPLIARHPLYLIPLIILAVWNMRYWRATLKNWKYIIRQFRSPMIFSGATRRRESANKGLTPTADGWHPQVAPTYVEWWYFDALLDGGGALAGSFSITGYVPKPETLRANVEFILHIPGSPSVKIDHDYAFEYFEASRDLCDVRVGNNLASFSGSEYILYLDEPDLGLDLRIKPLTSGFQLGDDGKAYFDKKSSRFFGWVVPVPRGKVTGTVRTNTGETTVRGLGYHDHNLATIPFADVLESWFWGRWQTENFSLIFAQVVPKYGKPPFAALALTGNQRIEYLTFNPDSFRILPKSSIAIDRDTGIMYYSAYTIEAEDEGISIGLDFQDGEIHKQRSPIWKFSPFQQNLIRWLLPVPGYLRHCTEGQGFIKLNGQKSVLQGPVIYEYHRLS